MTRTGAAGASLSQRRSSAAARQPLGAGGPAASLQQETRRLDCAVRRQNTGRPAKASTRVTVIACRCAAARRKTPLSLQICVLSKCPRLDCERSRRSSSTLMATTCWILHSFPSVQDAWRHTLNSAIKIDYHPRTWYISGGGRVVKATDSKSVGLCPHRFESYSPRIFSRNARHLLHSSAQRPHLFIRNCY